MFSGDGVHLINSVPVEDLTLAEAEALVGTIDAVLGAEAFLQSIIDANTKANYGAPIDVKSALETLRKKLPTWWDDV